jgi:AAA domain/Primase C terminal 2 (PriCT-2)/Bifunctional DNA primase/polymerase, N-terminal
MSDAASPSGVSPSAVDHARAYIGRRWSPIPIPEGKKGPQIPGWPNLRITEVDAPRYFNGKCNIGINLGEASGGLTDLDLDCPEALDIAPKVLPQTAAIFGRAGKPRSHWLYRVDGVAPTKKFLDPVSGDILLEIRGDGGLQTVFPGSVHPSGELIEWETDGQPATIDPTELVRRAGWLAAFCLVKRYCQQVKDSASLPAALDAIDPRISSSIREWLGIQPANPVNPFNGAADGQGLGLGPRPSWLRPLPADESTRLWALSRLGMDDWEWCPTNETQLRSALSVIPAVNRDVWLRVGMALHATGWPNAFEIWDAWSRTCAEKYNEADQRRTWDSFHGPRAGASITLGTVFYLAIEHGWTEDRVPGDSGTRPETGQPNDASKDGSEGATQRRDFMMSAAELRTMRFDPVRYVLPGFVPEGLTLLVGRPKIGKSWWALDLSVACAANRPTLGTLTPEHGDVLYLALEDGWRRLQRRLDKLLGAFRGEWPERLTFVPMGRWRRSDQGGLEDIEAWCKWVPNPTVIVVDTLERFRKPASGKSPLYSADYEAIAGLQKIATDYGIAIVVLHHDRKSDADDAFDTVSGTLGLTGAADTILIIKRRASGVVLHARGRDIEESETAMQFEKETCRWTILGKASEVHRSTERARVIAALTGAGQPLSVRDIMIDAEMQNRNAVDILLSKMAKDGEIVRVGRGRYHLSTQGQRTDRTERKI